MRVQRRAFIPPHRAVPLRATPGRVLPIEIAFLAGHVDPEILATATSISRHAKVCAAQALIAEGWISASFFYRQLADYLGVAFDETWPMLESGIDVRAALRLGRLKVPGAGPPRWLFAPQGQDLRALLSGRVCLLDKARVAITTPAHLAALVQYRAQPGIEAIATHELSRSAPLHSAKGAVDARTLCATILVTICVVAVSILAPRLASVVLGLLFLGGMVLRMLVAAASCEPAAPPVRHLSDAELPRYTVLVPLHREAEVLPDLLDALTALDYPRAKLEVLILIEPEDHLTREALAAAALPPWLQVVFTPRTADLRTKPRALNVGLAMATGALLTVYDAEDRPDPGQLRLAAATFRARPDLVCLQARIAIDNGGRALIARMFALEYAALFEVLNVGTAMLGLPLALGGTSNHFRCATLRTVGGWDAWNVTEDADLGLRLAQLGHRIGDLASTTLEAAPEKAAVWIKQRRRWMKGWMQTFLVITRDAPTAARNFGMYNSLIMGLLLVNMVLAPLCLPFFSCLVLYRLAVQGIPTPHGALELLEATIAASVLTLGIVSTLWVALVGMNRRGLRRFLPGLPLLLPYQLMISAAAWMGLWDLVFRPYHWHKTPHARHVPAADCLLLGAERLDQSVKIRTKRGYLGF